jgi:DnaJ-domain-containing protein 1
MRWSGPGTTHVSKCIDEVNQPGGIHQLERREGERNLNMPTLIVFCHLRWDFVFQRPQHLMTRLAEHYRILLVEEPIYHEGQAHLKKTAVAPNITVIQPHTPIHSWGFHDDQLPTLQTLLADLVPQGEKPVVWFYTPMALPLLQAFDPALVVYDCMDELAAFKNAPKQLLQRESALLNMADLCFTGGPSLYESKKDRHPNAHCFSSSVDARHFEQAQNRGNSHPDQAHVAHPRLGFYGVIDERFDTELIRQVAAARPQWQIVLVGPVVKIDPKDLPQAPNIHYMGQRNYDDLPKFLAGWDVCLLPFALNDSTKFISPTKVLEYMAAGLPSVSTPITDVKVPYGDVVAIADTPEKFIAACERMLAMNEDQQAALKERMRAIVANTSWDKTATRMHELIQTTVPGNKADRLLNPVSDVADAANVDALPLHAANAARVTPQEGMVQQAAG